MTTLSYKNLELTPGIDESYFFDIVDDNFLGIDLTNYQQKFEVFDSNNFLIYTDTSLTSSGVGSLTINVSANNGLVFQEGVYTYRLVLIDTNSKSAVYYQGFLTVQEPSFSLTSSPVNSSITLPDGTIYASSPTSIVPGQWYAIATYFRFLVSGIGTLVIDGRNLNGTVYLNLEVYQSQTFDQVQWIPDLTGMTAFRINQPSGTNTILYLP